MTEVAILVGVPALLLLLVLIWPSSMRNLDKMDIDEKDEDITG